MNTVIIILILVVSVLLGLVVLVQNSKGGGLISNFGSANQMMGVRQTTDFLEKATWTMAIILVVLCLASSLLIQTGDSTTASGVNSEVRDTYFENNAAVAPVSGADMSTGTDAANSDATDATE
ncbi:MAG: preprotein translocase subunit SecG [Bacteroidales bacterium]|nr:preprotein translocase subunit SecG [Bacteroidales bacterium]